jgi:23S rRNA pseudouridine2605 synthase
VLSGILVVEHAQRSRVRPSKYHRHADDVNKPTKAEAPGTTRRVHLNRAMSKLGMLTRSQATEAILAGRVTLNGRTVVDPAALVDMDRARIAIDGTAREPASWRTLLVHKPRGVVTTRRDPERRRTIYDVIGKPAEGLIPVGRLDIATAGLLLMTTDRRLADWLTDPANAVPRVYLVTVRGRVESAALARLARGIHDRGELLKPSAVLLRKASARESHLTVELAEGKNREVRRVFEAIGHEVTRLKRVRFGALVLGELPPGRWRDVDRAEVRAAYPAFQSRSIGRV